MTSSEEYDAIVIGASKAALFLSPALVQAGWRTAQIEREYLGGVSHAVRGRTGPCGGH